MVDRDRLKGIVYAKVETLTKCSDVIGTSKDNLSKKLKGKSKFTVDQIEKFVLHYKCSSDEAFQIFFGI